MAGDWQEVEFAALCEISRGASPRPIHEWISDVGVPWLKIADATSSGSRFIERTNERIRFEGRAKSVSVFPGDLILSNSATPGIPMFLKIEACIHDGWLLLRNFRGIDKLFCYYLLLHERPNIVQQGTGTIFTNLKTEILKRHRIKLPPLSEQHAIAYILGTLDDKIELNHRMNETLEAMARALFKSWFVDFAPVRTKAEGRPTGLPKHIADLFPDSFEDSELGEIPKGWDVGCVDDEFDLIMGQSPPGETYNSNGDGLPFYQGRTDFTFRFPERRVYCTAPTRFAKVGDTLISVRAPVGDINMASEDCAIGRGVAAARHKTGSRSYTYQFMHGLADVFGRFEAEGTVFGCINKKDFHDLPCAIPKSGVIKAFEGLIAPLDGRIEISERESGLLTDLRDTLLPKLISGELRTHEAKDYIGRQL